MVCQLKPDRFDADVIIEVPQKSVRLMRLSYSSKEISKSQNISFILLLNTITINAGFKIRRKLSYQGEKYK